jgi:hypothetical protein
VLIAQKEEMGIGQRLMQKGISQIKHLFFGRFDVKEKTCPILVEKPLPLLGLHHDFVIDLQVQLRTKGLDKSSSVPEPMGGKIRCFGGGIEPAVINPQTLYPSELSPLILPYQFFPDPVLCAESGPVVFNP